jgi:membrane protein YdbS with pleckstrin-like domain
MKTSSYILNVWATTLVIAAAICALGLTIYVLYVTTDAGPGIIIFPFLLLIATFFAGSLFYSPSCVLFILLAYFFEKSSMDLHIKKGILCLSMVIGILPCIFYFDDIPLKNILLLVAPYFIVSTLSTFLYPWQPEND